LEASIVIIILGLLILAAAAVIVVAGFFSNTGSAHGLHGLFSVFGYHVTGSTGTLFLFGAVLGAVGMLGLALLLTGARHTSRRGLEARRALKHSRREAVAAGEDRDALVEQRDSARAQTQSVAQERDDLAQQRDTVISRRRRVRADPQGTRDGVSEEGDPVPAAPEPHRSHLFGRRPAHHS
jgi:hypothetical protein